MKYSATILSVLALSTYEVAAFPAALLPHVRAADSSTLDYAALEEALAGLKDRGVERRAPGFDATAQYVSNQGQYAFVAPNFAAGDQRGPCPGLNAMANHGYLPHNGVATIEQFTTQTNKVFGMGLDLGAFLSVYGAVFDGDLTQWSIGGPTPAVGGLALLSSPEGISGSHNKYESDVSPTRPDLYEYGNAYKVRIEQFKQLYDMQPEDETANYDLDVLTAFRASRFQQSIENNPYFFNGPFSGVAVQPAAYTFIYRFMANKSAEYPEGRLNQEVLKSFFSITGDSTTGLQWKEGYERIPDNWYKRAIGDEYTIPFFITDLGAAAQEHPEFLAIGGNQGKVNTFAGVDLENFTGGLYNLQNLFEGNNLACFVYQNAAQATPDLLRGLFNSVVSAQSKINSAFQNAFGSLGCPQLAATDAHQFDSYPGSKVPNAVNVAPV